MVPKAQQDPHWPWSLIGVTAPSAAPPAPSRPCTSSTRASRASPGNPRRSEAGCRARAGAAAARLSQGVSKAKVALWDEAISPHDIDKGSEDRWAARVTVREHSTWDMAA